MTTNLIAERLAKVTRQRSSAAEWSQKLAIFSAPYLALVILGHRTGLIETPNALWLLAIGIAILLAAVVMGVKGFHDLWTEGRKGGLASSRGVLIAFVLLLPFLYQGVKTFTLPPIYDISTDLESPPEFDIALQDRSDDMNSIVEPSEIVKRLQLRAYPKVVARRYPLDAGRVFVAVAELVRDREWVVLTSDTNIGDAPIDDVGSGLVAKPVADDEGMPLRVPIPRRRPAAIPTQFDVITDTQQVSPIGRDTDGETLDSDERYVEAVAFSFIFGFEADVVIRVVEEEEGTLVDMRSNSRWGPHDLGSNAARIISFINDLDASLQGLSQ